MNYFLLVYDRAAGKLREERQFGQRAEVLQARFALERLHRAEGEDPGGGSGRRAVER